MAKPFTLDEYKRYLPARLWRVTHRLSQSRWHQGDLVAADQSRVFNNEDELKEAVQKHVNWWCSQPSCFLSVFSDPHHARNWAAQRDPPAYIHEIDTARLPIGTDILDMGVLIAKLGIKNPHPAHELLFLHRIPSECIVDTSEASNFQYRFGARSHYWAVDPVDAYDSDDSIEERNRNDDILKMIEGLWE
ncbi:1e3bdfa8-175f-46d9-90fe-025104075a22 [Thermothielavioides terrestris]|uniref:DUF7587 domain-containing protein n=2 Tax=Thermothielavioides terrestris TaxID=2587410 RepID=G2QYT7_THETT|nr:uncharacterized protein THITE_110789 [Thermothielavioides terrestris NRRL 8126]AEO66279.1 hypothetical protein THITE_110789 [Thermothielavioides terrestris NRRL 8126]SPQ25387.1 1e3bdfa8-175f-46d9-90fe-025104075a22 [Thermothielavioides terrestris]